MLDHIIGVEEAAEMWGMPTSAVETLCMQELIVSKRISETWVIYKNQNPNQVTEKEAAMQLSEEIEWVLLSPAEQMAILDENTRIFNKRVRLMRLMKERNLEEKLIRYFFEDLTDKEYEKVKEFCDRLDNE